MILINLARGGGGGGGGNGILPGFKDLGSSTFEIIGIHVKLLNFP